MVLTVLKHGCTWDSLAAIFKMKSATFEKLIVGYMKKISTYLYEISGKHKLYGLKVEVSVLPNGMAINCSRHHPGSHSDIDIFRQNFKFHQNKLRKKDHEKEFEDHGVLSDQYSHQWAVLTDKGYQGLQEVIRAIHPIKKKSNIRLTLSEKTFNREVSSDRIIVENYFGRLTMLWEICSRKYRWQEDMYDVIFSMAVALTNFHISKHPLRLEDREAFGANYRILLSCKL
jgi:hypothetical protein